MFGFFVDHSTIQKGMWLISILILVFGLFLIFRVVNSLGLKKEFAAKEQNL